MSKSATGQSTSDPRQDFPVIVAALPATARQNRIAKGVLTFMAIVILIVLPFAHLKLYEVSAFIPVLQTVMCFADLITAGLLFAQFSIQPMRALLALASGYIFSGMFAFLQTFAFPGAYAPNGLVGDGSNSAAWLFLFWHSGFSTAVVAYALTKDADESATLPDRSVGIAISTTIVCVMMIIVGLTWVVTARVSYLPDFYVTPTQQAPLARAANFLLGILSVGAASLLFVRRRTVLDVWLIVTVLATLADHTVAIILAAPRFTAGWYMARGFALVASCTTLLLLLTETTFLYARLANVIVLLRREREGRLMHTEAVVAAIAHEVRQPLASITNNSAAAQTLLMRFPSNPATDQIKEILVDVERDGFRANEVFANLRALFSDKQRKRYPIDANELAREALHVLRRELKDNAISTNLQLSPDLPLVAGHGGQLREVILNIIQNAIDAMATVADGERFLRLETHAHGAAKVAISVEDSGPGIDQEEIARIFDPFVTTKASGIGLGLAVCKKIVEQHGGHLLASSERGRGARFEVVLPTLPA
ncbi:GHKL domain-containing protein [Mesorhizobium sp. M2E.F.Ca.ET.209.01.1.1]|uniref:ATP-binding protein n=1 Tax=Mesorhizobium sp. M2E.F.Ca.ET.209.01.1.1 TaxID=2500526 RepID=UPI000FDB8CC9|nr:ATP-binding protein [Mesorhizobium sp. M2E.F.Ca.ET.209.01.1.1]TGS09647.1 GHKL domain-containing protein [Mesorhizobium sp. M2E.F.Ca.ET.209.01.1.1]